jgi:hypothetical protein
MEREELRKQALSRRREAEPISEVKKPLWHCEFCTRDFVQEKSFMSHRCKDRERIEELRSPIGQGAYAAYSEWMKIKKRSVPSIEVFSTSTLYSTFIKFAEHVQKTSIPNVKQFIKLMVQHGDVTPGLWCRDNVYAMYLEWYDQGFPPEIQVLESLQFTKELSLDFNVNISDIFKSVPVDTLVLYIKRRKLSTWFLASSKVFRSHLSSCPEIEKEKLERAMNLGGMIARIQKDAGLFSFINRVTESEGL